MGAALAGFALLGSALGLSALSGAVKVCARYERGLSGKLRCKQWAAGQGYAQGPHELPDYYVDEARAQAGIRRAYRYRRSLPYNPRAGTARFPNTPVNIALSERTQAKFDTLPDPIKVKLLSWSKASRTAPRFVDESKVVDKLKPRRLGPGTKKET